MYGYFMQNLIFNLNWPGVFLTFWLCVGKVLALTPAFTFDINILLGDLQPEWGTLLFCLEKLWHLDRASLNSMSYDSAPWVLNILPPKPVMVSAFTFTLLIWAPSSLFFTTDFSVQFLSV